MLIQQLDINPRCISALLNARIHNVNKLLVFSNLEVQKRTGLNKTQVEEILKVAANSVLKTPKCTALNIFREEECTEQYQTSKLSTGCDEINTLLHGGILYPRVTEISGESASGKTQLCLQLCLMAQIPFNSTEDRTGSLYLCTEDVFPTKRLQQMASLFCESNKLILKGKSPSELTNHIFIEHASDLDDLLSLLEIRLPLLLSKGDVKLIIIDSITALFRAEFESWELSARAKMLSKVGSLLHKLSNKHKCCIICVNQVSAVIDHNKSIQQQSKLTPALGLTWSYYVSTRIMLSRTPYTLSMFDGCKEFQGNNNNKNLTGYDLTIRCCKILFAPHLPCSECYFLVTEDGVRDFIFPKNL